MKTKSILLIVCIAMLTSCAGKFGVMKRRYNKGYYVSVTGDRKAPVKQERHDKTRTVKAENEQITTTRVDAPAKNQPVATVVTPEREGPAVKKSGHHTAQVFASAGRPKVSAFKARSLARELKTQARTESNKGASDANAIVLIILCIFLPPLAVYLFHNAINADFWLSLILTLLFWVPGVVYAFLVCFAGVSIA